DVITGEVRLDQGPGLWLTARGSVPIDLFSGTASTKPVDVAIRSSTVDLALLEGLPTAGRNVTGTIEIDVSVKGRADDPVLNGFTNLQNVAFEAPATGARYRNGTAHLTFGPQAINMERFPLEDSRGNPLELTGTAGTSELRLGNRGFEVSATQFEVLHNQLGTLALNGVFTITGTLAAPSVSG